MIHSPGACQGLSALEEVAPAAVDLTTKSYFQLVAGGLDAQFLLLLVQYD